MSKCGRWTRERERESGQPKSTEKGERNVPSALSNLITIQRDATHPAPINPGKFAFQTNLLHSPCTSVVLAVGKQERTPLETRLQEGSGVERSEEREIEEAPREEVVRPSEEDSGGAVRDMGAW